MWLLVTFILAWAFAPGPLTVVTLHETRKHGVKEGVAISAGAALTCLLMVVAALLIHKAGFSSLLASGKITLLEQVGALGIISMGLYAGYKGLQPAVKTVDPVSSKGQLGFFKGLMMMATYIPQALVFYGLIVPKTVEPQSLVFAIVCLGILKTCLMFGWHAAIALVTSQAQNWLAKNRFGKPLELTTACLIIMFGFKILA